jgi:hypothetical protein
VKQFLLFIIFIGSLCLLNACGSSPPPPPPVADFNVVITPASVSTKVGGTSAPVTVTLNAVNGFTSVVSVTISGFPNGINSSPASPFTISAGMSQQVTFSAPAAAGTFTVEFQGASGTLSHSADATLTVMPPQSPYLVSATYYPWYDASAFEYTVDCFNDTLRGELVPPELPVLGKYDSHSEDVVTQQIAWSTAAGVNVWDLEWVMPNDSLDSTIQNTILTNPHIGDLRFAIFYDYAIRFNVDLNVTPDKIATIVSDFQYLAAHYFLHPSYLKIGQGRPVVFFYFSAALNPVFEIQQMVASIRTAITAAGFNIYLVGDEYNALAPPDPTRIGNWDGIFGYGVDLHYSGYSDDQGFLALHSTMYSQYQAVANQLGVDFIPSVTPGFNDRATRRICANDPALARRTSAAAAEGSMFTNFVKDLAFPCANKTQFKMVHITTFNEWHEDSQIEPSVVTGPTTIDTSPSGSQYTQGLVYQGYGTTYLDILRNQIAAAKQ